MPEKPEVISVSKYLKKHLIGRKILKCSVYWDNIIAFPTPLEFKEKIANQEIHDIKTRGKFIMFTLDDYYLLVHLRMEGKFLFRDPSIEIGKHEHVEFIMNDSLSVRFHDVRKFGKMYLIEKNDIYNRKPLSELGFEYNDSKLDGEVLYSMIHSKKLPIKTLLLDQKIITGIGNIYADEILFLSKINPLRPGVKVNLNECSLIVDSTRLVFEKAISLGGTTIKSFTSSEGVHGQFQNELLVHGREGSFCSVCGNRIKKIKIGGRGTYYCEKCQK